MIYFSYFYIRFNSLFLRTLNGDQFIHSPELAIWRDFSGNCYVVDDYGSLVAI